MSADKPIQQTTSLRVAVGDDGTHSVIREGETDDNPRPLGDEELDAISGGATFNFNFSDGCTISVQGTSFTHAMEAAIETHEILHPQG